MHAFKYFKIRPIGVVHFEYFRAECVWNLSLSVSDSVSDLLNEAIVGRKFGLLRMSEHELRF